MAKMSGLAMNSIVLLDTSIYLNVLDVPGYNQDRAEVLAEFERLIRANSHFLLPMATIWETGNHIANVPGGQVRRDFAAKLVNDVRKTINGESPYRPTHFPDQRQFLAWLDEFPDVVMRQKSPKKHREGVSLSDLSIIKEWEQARARHSMSRVFIWSLDDDPGRQVPAIKPWFVSMRADDVICTVTPYNRGAHRWKIPA